MHDQSLSRVIQDVVLQPLEDGTRQSAIARRLHQAIMLGLFEDGGQLPSESDLAAQLSVSTVTLRSALAELRSLGLVETRRGRGGGNFIRMPEDDKFTPLMSVLERFSVNELRDIRDHAGVVCGGIARLAASRAIGTAVERLRASVHVISKATKAVERAHADFWFHMEIAAATRSPMLTKAELEIQTTMASLVWLPGTECLTVEKATAQHMEIVDAIAGMDGDAAQKSAEAHVHQSLNPLIDLRMRILGRTT